MLPLDHIPLTAPDLEALAQAMRGLGFTVSPRGGYTSPETPDARWTNHSVFLRRGWFDLLHAPGAPADAPVAPGACLFLSSDIDAALESLAGFRTRPPYRLERRWDEDLGLPPETFALFDIRERISPLGLAVISHHYPCHDVLPAWMEHANTAVEVAGLVFGGAEPGAFAERAAQHLDLSGLQYWSAERFEAGFGPMERQIAVRIRVASLEKAKAAAQAAALKVVETGDGLHVTPPAPLACGFEFFEA